MTKGFDYRHRPAKNIERHLVVELTRRFMGAFPKVSPQYVGMGALEFIDFELMHRSLNIDRMYSIEKGDPARFEFNKPFKTITLLQGTTSDVLRRRTIDLDRTTVMWFDYTDCLNASILSDVIQVSRTISAPGAFFVTLNANPTRPISSRLDSLIENVGRDYVPAGTSNESLGGHGLAAVQRSIFDAVVRNSLAERRDDVGWSQVANFTYRDNALMQTVGGFFLPAGVSSREVRSWLADLDFFAPSEDAVDLRVPVITPRERALLDRQLPKRARTPLRLSAVPPTDLEAYRRIYRYLHLAGLQSAAETTWVS